MIKVSGDMQDNIVYKLAECEVGWWKAHHRKDVRLVTSKMEELYRLLYGITEEQAKHCVDMRVKAGFLHDKAEFFEDQGDVEKAKKYWDETEDLLRSHFSMLLTHRGITS